MLKTPRAFFSNLLARPGRLACRLGAYAVEILARHRLQRRVLAHQEDDPARERERQLLDPEAEVPDEERLGRARLAAEQPHEDDLAHALAGGRGRDERPE